MSIEQEMRRLLSSAQPLPTNSGSVIDSPVTPTVVPEARRRAPSPHTAHVARSLLPEFNDIENAVVGDSLPAPAWSGGAVRAGEGLTPDQAQLAQQNVISMGKRIIQLTKENCDLRRQLSETRRPVPVPRLDAILDTIDGIEAARLDIRREIAGLSTVTARALTDVQRRLSLDASPVSKVEVESLLRWQAKQLFKAITIQLRKEMTNTSTSLPPG